LIGQYLQSVHECRFHRIQFSLLQTSYC